MIPSPKCPWLSALDGAANKPAARLGRLSRQGSLLVPRSPTAHQPRLVPGSRRGVFLHIRCLP